MGSYLVVANQTLGGEALASHLRRIIDADAGARFVVMVPLSTTSAADVGGAMGVMGGLATIALEMEGQLNAEARRRLRTWRAWLHDAGVEAEGSLVSDPLGSMKQAIDARPFD